MSLALSIRQPWVELILQGTKTIEVRSWATQHRGELFLHAGLKPDIQALERFGLGHELTFGALVGKCQLLDCIEFTPRTWESWRPRHLNDGELSGRRYAWLLEQPIRTAPTPYKGRLGLMQIEVGSP